MAQLKIALCGGSRDGERLAIREDEQLAVRATSAAGVRATEIYQRRRVNGKPIVLEDGTAPFDFALRRREPA